MSALPFGRLPQTPQEQIRQQIRREVLVPALADLILKWATGYRHGRISMLKTAAEQAVYLAESEMWLDQFLTPGTLHELRVRVNRAQRGDDEQLLAFTHPGERQHFGQVPPDVCLVCREPVTANRATVWIGQRLKADAHGMCCANDDMRFEVVNEFIYQLKGAL